MLNIELQGCGEHVFTQMIDVRACGGVAIFIPPTVTIGAFESVFAYAPRDAQAVHRPSPPRCDADARVVSRAACAVNEAQMCRASCSGRQRFRGVSV